MSNSLEGRGADARGELGSATNSLAQHRTDDAQSCREEAKCAIQDSACFLDRCTFRDVQLHVQSFYDSEATHMRYKLWIALLICFCAVPAFAQNTASIS